MKTKTIIVLMCLAIIGLLIWGYSTRGGTATSVQGVSISNASQSLLIAPEIFYDFGTISMKNGDVSKEFTITNPTDQDITLKTVLTSCMCTSAFIVGPDGNVKGPFKMPGMGYVPPANEIIKASESRIIRVVYNPNAHGPAGVGQLQLEIKALVTP